MKPISRRTFLQGAATLGPALALGVDAAGAAQAQPDQLVDPSPAANARTLFVGTQTGGASKGIYAYTWDHESGTLGRQSLAAETPSPTYITLAPDRHFLFAANEVDHFQGKPSGGVSSFKLEGGPGKLVAVNATTSAGPGTCFVGVDPQGRVLLCANYTGGSAASFRIGPGGVLSPAVSEFHFTGHGPNAARQEAPHVHRAITSPSGKYALFCDLGLDVIHCYGLDTATARLEPHTPPVAWQAPAGAGPRSLRFHPNGRWAYCVQEMGASVALLDWDEAAGTLTTRQQVKLTPDGFTGRAQASEIVVTPSGRFAYAACRYYDILVSFSVDAETGELTMLGKTTCGGKVPRDIVLDPSQRWLLVANQDSDGIAIIRRDPVTGRLADDARVVPLEKPQCLVFA